MVQQHWPEIAAEFALAEGGSIVQMGGKVHHVLVSTTEKLPRGIRLVAHGDSGHASRPVPDNAVVRIAAAVARVGAWQTPVRLNQTTRAYFERLAAISPPQAAARYRAVLNPSRVYDVDAYFKRQEPGHYSLLRTSVVPTILKAGFRANVIPSEAEAYLDIRALPDEDMTKFQLELKRTIGDPGVDIIPQAPDRPPGPPSRIDSDMFRALENVGRRMFDAPTIPYMLTGATDSAQLRAHGVQAYGVGPGTGSDPSPLGGAHADDERISTAAFMRLTEYLWNVTLEIAAK
jgi:acetylornithine deacetylase/succinyl-diaminopimelate desuccinylase-like protein